MSKQKTISVPTPEWVDSGHPANTTIRKWCAGEWIDFQSETELLTKHLSQRERERLAHPRLVAWSTIDDDGKPIFSRPTLEMLDAVGDKIADELKPYYDLLAEDASVIRRVSLAAIDLHNISDASRLAIEKN